MIDAALIAQCADPGLKVEMVQEFVDIVGGADHLTVTVNSGERVVLVPKPNNRDEAMELVRQYAGTAVVRVGLTQYPAGFGIQDVSELSYDLFDSCENLRMGTTLFSKVYRIVNQRYEDEGEAFQNAVRAYQTGWFEGERVFYLTDPAETETTTAENDPVPDADDAAQTSVAANPGPSPEQTGEDGDPYTADIRIDLTGINGGDGS